MKPTKKQIATHNIEHLQEVLRPTVKVKQGSNLAPLFSSQFYSMGIIAKSSKAENH